MRGWALRLAAVLALAVGAPACFGGAQAEGVLRAAEVRGSVRVHDARGWQALQPGRSVAAGDEVRTADGAMARLTSGKTSVDLGSGGWIRVDAADRLSLLAGAVLVVADRVVSVDDQEHGVAAQGSGAVFRFDRGVRVGVYSGTVTVAAPTSVAVSGLSELDLEARVPQIHPFAIQATDPWDIRYLADAIEVDRQLRAYQRGFDATFAGQASAVGFFGRFVQRPDVGAFLGPLLPSLLRSVQGPSEILVGLVYALQMTKGGGSISNAFGNVLQLRELGASWGLIAHQFGLKPSDILKTLTLALTPPPPPPPTPSPTPTGGTGPRHGGDQTPSPRPSPSSGKASTPSPSPSPSGSPLPSPTPCDPVSQLLGRCGPGLLGDLTGGVADVVGAMVNPL